jgi:phage shock protein PspC (stress-responsive transcriptional regulator)
MPTVSVAGVMGGLVVTFGRATDVATAHLAAITILVPISVPVIAAVIITAVI